MKSKKNAGDVIHEVQRIDFDGPYMLLSVDGRDYKIDIRTQSKRLADAEERTKRHFVISPSGYGIHWPEIDEDLSIDGMIRPVNKAKPNSRKRR